MLRPVFRSFFACEDQRNGRLVRGFNWCPGESMGPLGAVEPRKVNQAFPEDWSSWFRKYALRHEVRVVFLERRNDLRRIFSVEANRKVPVYATKDAGEATKVRHSKIELDVKNLTKDLLKDKQKVGQVKQLLRHAKAGLVGPSRPLLGLGLGAGRAARLLRGPGGGC